MEAIAAAKVRKVFMVFSDSSTQRPRAVDTISAGLARNKFIRDIALVQVPEVMIEPTRQTLLITGSCAKNVDVY